MRDAYKTKWSGSVHTRVCRCVCVGVVVVGGGARGERGDSTHALGTRPQSWAIQPYDEELFSGVGKSRPIVQLVSGQQGRRAIWLQAQTPMSFHLDF